MKKKILLLILFLIFVISTISFFLILNYLDPYSSPVLAISFLVITFILSISTFFCLILYILKKIYYRGNVGIYHIKTSFRQASFISYFLIGVITLKIFGISVFLSAFIFGILFLFLELFIQNLSNK